jgi:protein SCO1/2
MKSRRYGLVFGIAAFLATLCLVPVVAQRGATATFADLAKLGHAPDFTLTDQAGKLFALANVAGKIWVADFFLTTCQGACPIMSGNLHKLQEAFANDQRVRFVSVSVDPETDTPATLEAYSQALKADTNQWRFLTGPIDEVHRLEGVDGFKVGVSETPMAHSRRFVLVDRDGNIRGYYDGTDDHAVERVKHDIKLLLSE